MNIANGDYCPRNLMVTDDRLSSVQTPVHISMPLKMVFLLHEHLAEGPCRDAIGYLSCGEEIPRSIKSDLRFEGINTEEITCSLIETGEQYESICRND